VDSFHEKKEGETKNNILTKFVGLIDCSDVKLTDIIKSKIKQ